MTQASAGATHWNKPSESRFCGRSAKPIGLSVALVERQLAWASRGRRSHTRWISWGSLGLPSETVPNLCLLVGRVVLAKMRLRYGYMHLKYARLPIPPHPEINYFDSTRSNTYLKLMRVARLGPRWTP